MAVNQKIIKVMNKVFAAGFTEEQQIIKMNMDDILKIPGITVADILVINDLQKSIKTNKVITFLGASENSIKPMERGMENENNITTG